MTTFSQINLAAVPPPDVVEPLDYEQILAEMVADLIEGRRPAIDPHPFRPTRFAGSQT